MTTTRPADCGKPRASWGSCIQALAGGWILTGDLCPVCTRTFMSALGAAVPYLDWCEAYRERAAVQDVRP